MLEYRQRTAVDDVTVLQVPHAASLLLSVCGKWRAFGFAFQYLSLSQVRLHRNTRDRFSSGITLCIASIIAISKHVRHVSASHSPSLSLTLYQRFTSLSR